MLILVFFASDAKNGINSVLLIQTFIHSLIYTTRIN
jgi:hypothetical protein